MRELLRSLTAQWPERLAHAASAAGADAVALVALGEEGPQVTSLYGAITPSDWPERLGAGLVRRVSKDGEPLAIALDGSITDGAGQFTSAILVPARTDPPLVVTFFRRQPQFTQDDIGRATAIGRLLVDLHEETRARLRAATAVDHLDERLRAHDDLRPAIAAAGDAAALLEEATRTIARRFEAAGASIMLIGPDGELRVRAAVGLAPEIVRTARRRVGEGIAGWVAERKEGLLLHGHVDDWRFRGVDPEAGPALSVPMRVGADVVGVLNVKRPASADPFDESHLRILGTIADDLAASLRNVQRIERLEDDRRHAVAMAEIAAFAQAGDRRTAARLACEVFDFGAVGVARGAGDVEVLYAREGASLTAAGVTRVSTPNGAVVFAPGPATTPDDEAMRQRLAPLFTATEAPQQTTPTVRPGSRPIRVFLVGDHPVVREGLRAILEADGDISVVGVASTATDAASSFAEARPDLILCDLHLPDAAEAGGVRRLRGIAANVPIVVLSVESTAFTVTAALQEGARGYIPKRATPEELRASVRAAIAGLVILHPETTFRAAGTPQGAPAQPAPPPVQPPKAEDQEVRLTPGAHEPLTPREMEYLRYIADGYTNKEIAQVMVLAEDTVKKGVQTLIAKLGAADRTHAVVLALRNGLIA